jgi:hypothetical protein
MASQMNNMVPWTANLSMLVVVVYVLKNKRVAVLFFKKKMSQDVVNFVA